MIVEQIKATEIMTGNTVWAPNDGDWLKVARVEDDGGDFTDADEVTVYRADGSEATFRANGDALRQVASEDLTYEQLMPSAGDAVVMIRKHGRALLAYVRREDGVYKLPSEWSVDYGDRDDPPLTIRRLTIKAGWTLKQWRARKAADAEEAVDAA